MGRSKSRTEKKNDTNEEDKKPEDPPKDSDLNKKDHKNVTLTFGDRCMWPKLDWIECRPRVPRYMYNHYEKICETIGYTGCDDPGWNFYYTWEECRETCKEDRELTCNMPPDNGSDGPFYRGWRWYHSKGECYQFVYEGDLGNLNNFNTHKECMDFCGNKSTEPNNGDDSTTSKPNVNAITTERPLTPKPITSAKPIDFSHVIKSTPKSISSKSTFIPTESSIGKSSTNYPDYI